MTKIYIVYSFIIKGFGFKRYLFIGITFLLKHHICRKLQVNQKLLEFLSLVKHCMKTKMLTKPFKPNSLTNTDQRKK